jgi:hypothetical protein
MRAVKPASSIPIGFPAHRNLGHEARDAQSVRLPAAPIGTYLYSEFLRNYQRGTAKLPWGGHTSVLIHSPIEANYGLRSAWFKIDASRTPALLSCSDTS